MHTQMDDFQHPSSWSGPCAPLIHTQSWVSARKKGLLHRYNKTRTLWDEGTASMTTRMHVHVCMHTHTHTHSSRTLACHACLPATHSAALQPTASKASVTGKQGKNKLTLETGTREGLVAMEKHGREELSTVVMHQDKTLITSKGDAWCPELPVPVPQMWSRTRPFEP